MSNLLTGNFPAKTYRNLNLGVVGQVIKSTKGQIFDLHICNQAAAIRYVKLYDLVTVPLSTDTPVRTYAIPASTTIALPVTPAGIEYLLGIGARGTTGVADNDTGAPAANDIIVNLSYL